MSEEHQFTIIITSISAATALIGTLGASLIAPYISNRQEKNKAKRRLKPELVKLIYNWYMLRKLAYENITKKNYQIKIASFLFDASNDSKRTDQERTKSREEFHKKKEEISNYANETSRIVSQQIEIESTILSLVSEIGTYYGMREYDEVNSLVVQRVIESNDTSQYVTYDDMKLENINKERTELTNIVHNKWLTYDEQYATIIASLNHIL